MLKCVYLLSRGVEPELVFSAENLISENFIEALKTLEAFQVTMTEEQTRWTDANMELNVYQALTQFSLFSKPWKIGKIGRDF